MLPDLLLLALLACCGWAIGWPILFWLRCRFVTGSGHAAASVALGLGALGYTVLALGLAGQLRAGPVAGAICLLTAVLWSTVAARAVRGERRCGGVASSRRPAEPCSRLPAVSDQAVGGGDSGPSRPAGPPQPGGGRTGGWLRTAERGGPWLRTALALTACIATLVGALAPPTAGDALCYHLEIPKRFIQAGHVEYLPLTDNSLFPFLMEMLYALGLMLSGPVLAKLMHWLMGLLLALVVLEVAEPLLGREAGRWAATATLLVPAITNQMTAPLNDLATALYSTLMVAAYLRWYGSGSGRWLTLAGVFAGLAISVKLVAVAMVVLVSAAVWWDSRRLIDGLKRAAAFAGVVLLCGGIWYARSWHYTGNPVYPYFNGWFGGRDHTPSVLHRPVPFWQAPWAVTMHPDRYGGRGHQVGAMFLALLPGLGVVGADRRLRRLLALAGTFFLVWLGVRQELRFLLPAVPLAMVAVVAVVKGLRQVPGPAFRAAAVCFTALMAFNAAIALRRARPPLAVACGWESRRQYLEEHEPSYRTARFVNRHLPTAAIVSQDYRGFYFEPALVREDALRRLHPYTERGERLVRLLAEWGFTHVLLVQSYNSDSAAYDAGFVGRLGKAAERLPVVWTEHFDGPDGDCRDYRLLALPSTEGPAAATAASCPPHLGPAAACLVCPCQSVSVRVRLSTRVP